MLFVKAQFCKSPFESEHYRFWDIKRESGQIGLKQPSTWYRALPATAAAISNYLNLWRCRDWARMNKHPRISNGACRERNHQHLQTRTGYRGAKFQAYRVPLYGRTVPWTGGAADSQSFLCLRRRESPHSTAPSANTLNAGRHIGDQRTPSDSKEECIDLRISNLTICENKF